jgi:hypothetical protein
MRPGSCSPSRECSALNETINGVRYVWQTPELLALVSPMAAMGSHSLTMREIAPLGAMLEGAISNLASVPMVLLGGGPVTVFSMLVTTVRALRVHQLA